MAKDNYKHIDLNSSPVQKYNHAFKYIIEFHKNESVTGLSISSLEELLALYRVFEPRIHVDLTCGGCRGDMFHALRQIFRDKGFFEPKSIHNDVIDKHEDIAQEIRETKQAELVEIPSNKRKRK